MGVNYFSVWTAIQRGSTMLLSGSPSVSPRSIILRPEDSGNPLSEGLPASDSRRSRPSRPHLHHRHRRRLRHHYRRTSARTIGVHNDIAVGIKQGDDVGILVVEHLGLGVGKLNDVVPADL